MNKKTTVKHWNLQVNNKEACEKCGSQGTCEDKIDGLNKLYCSEHVALDCKECAWYKEMGMLDEPYCQCFEEILSELDGCRHHVRRK